MQELRDGTPRCWIVDREICVHSGLRLTTSAGGCRSGRRGQVAAAGHARPYSASVLAHSETVLRGFDDLHLTKDRPAAASGPIMNPFPLDRARRGGRTHAHHNPMEPYCDERSGFTGRGCRDGSRGASQTRCSARSSPASPPTAAGRWWRSTSPPALVHRNCCRLPTRRTTYRLRHADTFPRQTSEENAFDKYAWN